MAQYRIQAWQWLGRHEDAPSWLDIDPEPSGSNVMPGKAAAVAYRLYVGTLQGVACAEPGDWIVKGMRGEIYPCKPDFFEAAVEPARRLQQPIT